MASTASVFKIIAAGVAAVSGIAVYAVFDPAALPFPKCPFYAMTGLKCPGCGSQRALHQLFNLNVAEAFRYNALLVAFIPVLAFLISADFLKEKHPHIYLVSHNRTMSWGIVATILLWWLLRNVFDW